MRARALRGSALTLLSFGGAQALRLASNLVLTRLLFPEAFGLMALVQVFMTGLNMFSDLGIRTSIMQSRRGDDRAFLDTAWTLQILRGVLLWLAACALAWPAAAFYGEEMLALLLPVAGLGALAAGFASTAASTANRHLMLGRLTLLELGTQAFGVAVMVVLAVLLDSVWSLVIGGLAASLAYAGLSHLVLHGGRNRLAWDRAAVRDLIGFGKYIFVGTIAGFLVSQGDRAILGKYISLADLAVYNIGFFLAAVPLLMCRQLVSRVMFPLYRERPPADGAQNRGRLAHARLLLTGSMYALCAILAFGGVALVELLYDPRYHMAGPILVLLSLANLPAVMTASYGTLLLAQGNSRDFTLLMLVVAAIRLVLMLALVGPLGVPGIILAMAAESVLSYPYLVRLMRRHGGWDPRHDALFCLLGLVLAALTLWLHMPAVLALFRQTAS